MIAADLRHTLGRWDDPPWRLVLAGLLVTPVQPRIRALFYVRAGMWCWRRGLKAPAHWCKARAIRAAGVEIHPAAEIGPGLLLAHASGIVVGHDVRAGRDLVLYQNVTLGHGPDAAQGQPSIGDGVRIFAGAVVLGAVHLGDGCRIGANAVVLADVAPGATAVGVHRRTTS